MNERMLLTTLGSITILLLSTTVAAAQQASVLIFSKTNGFRHSSIPDGIALVESLGTTNGFAVDSTEEPSAFTPANLANYDTVLFLSTTGNVLDTSQQEAFEGFIQAGGGFVGIHSATDTEYDWPWYGGLLGGDAWFQNHPAIQDAVLDVVDPNAASTSHYPMSFEFRDEWYNFQNDPSPFVDVLLTIDEDSYSGGSMGASHPISWQHEYDGGRSWYTAMGHRSQTFQDTDFQQHLLGGILWAVPEPGMPPLLFAGSLGLGYLYSLRQKVGQPRGTAGAAEEPA